MKKTLYTLCVNNYEPQITAMTFPLMEKWAKKIGAEFFIIKDRKFPDFPPVYEKFQIAELSKKHGNDWNIFFDADTLIHPDFFDFTVCLDKAATFSHGTDFTPVRFRPDKYFLRDGRFIGKGNWCLAASDWCAGDLWQPLDDLTLKEAVKNIYPTLGEVHVEADHLIDDYTVSRNISRFGLKHIILSQLEDALKIPNKNLLWHEYNVPAAEKLKNMQAQLITWAAQLFLVPQGSMDMTLLNQYLGQWRQVCKTTSWKDFLDNTGEVGKKTKGIIETSFGVTVK